ncbi:alpha/beta fold hydrolase [Aspergillus glaucus CBS 516.65]|uniref:AB hydrolase-1 domain-containing protein n=1 Tax=Aspergillus glaucus CBS 516.65 TaxID=1160497 RepID=A0A1L9VYG7_ASPGL|nr:hypothetical protein ASPGLDRAFT_40854 [Aspergillus glaucus CBS 516.65]OJJ88960.1 hypothetical protein ASPGLDRAFT_40854 [Aspergillus glaucus CBS 516.65]
MPNTKIVHVPHIGGIDAAYQMRHPYDAAKPTLALINSFTTSSDLYSLQYEDKTLTDKMNLLAIELLGHGQTRTKRENWTYWDTAEMSLQVLDALGIDKAFVLGTSQGGWITVRMALMRPEKIAGIIPLGTSLDFESEHTRQLNCWDAPHLLTSHINEWTTTEPTPDFQPDLAYCDFLIEIGFGKDECPAETRDFWRKAIRENYKGDEGRRRVRMAAINLRDRDGLHPRLSDIQCPVLWLHGTKDVVYSLANAQREIQLFINSPDAKLVPIEGGAHFLSASHPKEVDGAILEFVAKYNP